jgi:two-component system, chemotaxis family, response regulator PixH
VRVLQNGHMLARLSAIRIKADRFTAIWQGAPPPFEPSEQIEPLRLESDDGLERSDGWLLSVLKPVGGNGPLRVEIGSERSAPPWRRSSPSLGGRKAPVPLRPDSTRREILVVDDDPDTVALVAEVLENEGYCVRRATGGQEALDRAAASPPDVAIVDLIMPEVGGEDVCSALRRDPRYSETRILVLSAAEDTRMVAASCDADSAVTKPFTTELLVREVRRLMGQ